MSQSTQYQSPANFEGTTLENTPSSPPPTPSGDEDPEKDDPFYEAVRTDPSVSQPQTMGKPESRALPR